ncbi:hypothetical protein COEREDRAFT_82505 [Coemansia reversa NRRL 1564]|uniref:Uncharacterized protein n=1 Tax=Coemansia reversa (strain ATCC 12441 / NRRL 1564) TaxID=763665 RepID=A0A2G5B6X0_COERN|nr:hypothetical protein COEREDRAFT_82505 [Coemansia reversa NRRL 1564]|eukprot:PIA14750.1 hypothetical protein COEREDRAFT_82505 [Coemansia reversa NRRL 1564]
MRGFVTLGGLLVVLVADRVVGDTTDYDNFMSSLSYNWQNEFSGLRYQLDSLQKEDPDQYNQLAASLGLKPGTKISIPSLYSPQWASKFVAAADLYTPPAVTADSTPAATPTISKGSTDKSESGSVVTHLTTATDDVSDNSSDSESEGSSEASDSKDTEATEATSGLDENTDSADTQFGNPIVGTIDNNDSPIIPTGHGYSTASTVRPATISVFGVLSATTWLMSFV